MSGHDPRGALELADYRARVAELYLEYAGEGAEATSAFRRRRDPLFGSRWACPLAPPENREPARAPRPRRRASVWGAI